jgi:hypothetical protein
MPIEGIPSDFEDQLILYLVGCEYFQAAIVCKSWHKKFQDAMTEERRLITERFDELGTDVIKVWNGEFVKSKGKFAQSMKIINDCWSFYWMLKTTPGIDSFLRDFRQ